MIEGASHIRTFLGEMIKSKLPNNVLGKVWKLSDVDKDGLLDSDEFALAMHLINIKLDGEGKGFNEINQLKLSPLFQDMIFQLSCLLT